MTDISVKRIKEILKNIQKQRLLIVGDVMLDQYLWGSIERISPEAPVPVVDISSDSARLGGAANVANNIQSLGATSILIGVIGQDNNGDQLVEELEKQHISRDGLICDRTRPTTIKTRIMAKQQQVVRADRESCTDLSEIELKEIFANFEKALAGINGIIISDYGKGIICPVFLENIIAACQEKNLFIAVDPKERHFDLYTGVTVITPNLREAHVALGIPYSKQFDDKEIANIGWQIIDKFKTSYLLLTLSDRGMALFEKEGKKFSHLPTVARNVYDVTGAGDTVISIFSAAMICGASPIESAFIANHAAGITISEIGTASVDSDTLFKTCLE